MPYRVVSAPPPPARPIQTQTAVTLDAVRSRPHSLAGSHQPALRLGRGDEARKQRVGLERFGLELRMELHPDEPGMIGKFDRLGQEAIGRHAGEHKTLLFKACAVGGVDFVAVTMAFRNLSVAIDSGDARAGF